MSRKTQQAEEENARTACLWDEPETQELASQACLSRSLLTAIVEEADANMRQATGDLLSFKLDLVADPQHPYRLSVKDGFSYSTVVGRLGPGSFRLGETEFEIKDVAAFVAWLRRFVVAPTSIVQLWATRTARKHDLREPYMEISQYA